jgi:hypothetical protein
MELFNISLIKSNLDQDMRAFYFTFFSVIFSFYVHAQCSVQITNTSAQCYGDCNGTANAIATGVPPFSYVWQPGNMGTQNVTGLCPGAYTVIVTDSTSCITTNTVIITEPSEINSTVTYTNSSCSTCADGTATVNPGDNANYLYLWSPGGQTTQTIMGLLPGDYSVCITNAGGCTTCDSINISLATAVNNQDLLNTIYIFPNPVTHFLKLKIESNGALKTEVSITNILGLKTFTKKLEVQSFYEEEISVEHLPIGIYYLVIKTNEQVLTKKFSKQ